MTIVIDKAPIVLDEKTYRGNLRMIARGMGCELDLLQIFDKYDRYLHNCTSQNEKEAIAKMGTIEISRLFDNNDIGNGGKLTLNGKTLIESQIKKEDNATAQNR